MFGSTGLVPSPFSKVRDVWHFSGEGVLARASLSVYDACIHALLCCFARITNLLLALRACFVGVVVLVLNRCQPWVRLYS